jgi:cell division septation protein DedD
MVLFAAALFLAGAGLYAQNAIPGQLGTEIQALEQKVSRAGASPAERHDALVRLAQLRQLSGNIADAAVNWLDAAAADPNDDSALAAGAYCLAAIGEWEKAAIVLRPLLASGRGGPAMLQARFLDACFRAWSANDASALTALAGNSDFTAMRPMIYYTLWQTFTRNPGAGAAGTAVAESWKSRLLDEFPQSPEARALNPVKQKNLPAISTVQSPLWLIFPGTAGSAPVGTARPVISTPPAPAPAAPSPPAASAPTVSAPAPSPAASVAPSQAASAVVLQTGLFSKEANARAQSEALRKAGFTAFISRKPVNGVEYWVVTVPAGQDQRKTTADLKKAGFDSFPVK